MIREVSGGDGIAAWQALAKSYARTTLARVLRRYREVMNPVPAKELSEVVGVFARWEAKWKELERIEGVRLPDMVKMAALTELCPPDLRDLIFQTVDSGLTFDTMKEKVISWASNKVASRKEMPVHIDIGLLKDIQDWDDQTQEEEWHEVGAVGILATDVEEWGITPGNVPQPKIRAKARGKAKAKAKASTVPGPKNGNGQGKERARAKAKAILDRQVSAMGAVSMAIALLIARNGRRLRLSKMRKLKPRKKLCK